MNNLDELLKLLVDILKNTKDVVASQMPDILNQMLIYGAASATIWMWITGIIVVLCVIMIIIGSLTEEVEIIPISFVIGIVFAINFACNAMTLYKINHAPKLYLLQEISSMIQTK
jgi:uncharacterized membrane protein YphA (DoxX/SURF4 family)